MQPCCQQRTAFLTEWGIFVQHWWSSPVVWTVIVLILSGVGILRELL
jgi:hypothetical protein